MIEAELYRTILNKTLQTRIPMKKYDRKNAMNKLPNYMAVAAIVPAVLSVMAYEFVNYMINAVFRENPYYNPIDGLGILIPMALLMELFTFFFSKSLYKKMCLLTCGLDEVAKGNFNISVNEKKAGPFHDAAENFNLMTRELRSVETLRTDFINDFSHEFKTPITSINGFANLLLDTEVSEEERRQYLQIIADESERLATLAKETLLLSRLDSQTTIPDRQHYSLDEQLRQDVILLSPVWNEKNIDVSVELAPVTYYGNPDLMAHVWINILNNAVKFTPTLGSITISMILENQSIKVSVSDTGKGMTEEEAARIFNRYYQADASHSTKGLGLGLSIAARIVELCGGHITVTSEPGKGSTFTVVLPVKA